MIDSIYLLTGTNGFIGSHLFNDIVVNKRFRTLVIDRHYNFKTYNFEENISGSGLENLGNTVKNFNICFIHCATKFQNYNNDKEWQDLILANVMYPLTILIQLSKISTVHFINLNSYWQAVDGMLGSTNSLYAKSKNEFLSKLKIMDSYNSILHNDVYLFDTFGPLDKRKKLIPYLFETYYGYKTFELSDVGQVLNFLHITDVLAGIHSVIELRAPNKVYELSSLSNYTIKEVFDIFCGVVGKRLTCDWNDREPLTYMKEKWMIAEKPHTWKESISFDLGLQKLFLSNP